MTARPFTGCVLAGGRSSRMGQDKATLLLRGTPMVRHMVRLLQVAGFRPVIAASRPDLAPFAPILQDLHPGCGALSGIQAALHSLVSPPRATTSFPDLPVLFLPVDLPLLPPGFLSLLLDRALCTGALATIPLVGGRPQPLSAIYRTPLLPGITAALHSGDYKVMRVIDSLTTPRTLDLFAVEALQASASDPIPAELPAHLWFTNLNTPSDLLFLQQLVQTTRPRPVPHPLG